MKKKRRSWVKAEAVRLRVEERLSTREIAKRLSSFQGTVFRWVKDYPLTTEEIAFRRKVGYKKSGLTRIKKVTRLSSSGKLLRKCSECKLYKPDITFPRKPSGKILGCCSTCRTIRKTNHYRQNKQKYKKQATLRRKEFRRRLNILKNKQCVDCGKIFPPCAMQYDHLDPKMKVKSVSKLVSMGCWSTVLSEIDKCELVCAVCHAIRTHMGRTGVRKGLQNLS